MVSKVCIFKVESHFYKKKKKRTSQSWIFSPHSALAASLVPPGLSGASATKKTQGIIITS